MPDAGGRRRLRKSLHAKWHRDEVLGGAHRLALRRAPAEPRASPAPHPDPLPIAWAMGRGRVRVRPTADSRPAAAARFVLRPTRKSQQPRGSRRATISGPNRNRSATSGHRLRWTPAIIRVLQWGDHHAGLLPDGYEILGAGGTSGGNRWIRRHSSFRRTGPLGRRGGATWRGRVPHARIFTKNRARDILRRHGTEDIGHVLCFHRSDSGPMVSPPTGA